MKLYKILSMLAVVVTLGFCVACNDTPADLTPLNAGNPYVVDATFNSLTLKWDKVEGATQYSYTLTATDKPDKVLSCQVTNGTMAKFVGLEPSTDYILTVLAYAPYGSATHTTSKPMVIIGRTADLIALGSTQITWSREVNTILCDWDAVDGATEYIYRLTDASGSVIKEGYTIYNYIDFPTMTTGVYTFTVQPLTDTQGYADGPEAMITIDFVRQHLPLWSIDTDYKSGILNQSWTVTLVAYDDNVYSIEGWYGVKGYNLDFTINANDPDNQFVLVGDYPSDGKGGYLVPTGLATPSTVTVIPGNNQCAMEGTSGQGSVKLAVSHNGTAATDGTSWVASIDSFVGTWNFKFSYVDYYDDTSSEDRSFDITLGTKANTLILPIPSYYGGKTGTGVATVDLSTMTFSMAPVKIGSYTFAGNESIDSPITGTISGNMITVTNMQVWWTTYKYLESFSYVLTR